MLVSNITLPKTMSELIVSHTFNSFIFPQQFANVSDLSALILNVNNNNLFNGVTKVSKDFGKTTVQRYSLSSPFESFQTIPGRLSYALTLDKVVFYNTGNALQQLIEAETNGMIKQFVPFVIEEIVKKPDGTVKETVLYLDVWFETDKSEFDLAKEDMLVTKTLTAKVGRMVTIENDFVGITSTILEQALGSGAANVIINQAQQIANNIVKNFTIPS